MASLVKIRAALAEITSKIWGHMGLVIVDDVPSLRSVNALRQLRDARGMF